MSETIIKTIDDLKQEIPLAIKNYENTLSNPKTTEEVRIRIQEMLEMALAYQWVFDGCPKIPAKSLGEISRRRTAKMIVNMMKNG
jgi:hypothetical protein